MCLSCVNKINKVVIYAYPWDRKTNRITEKTIINQYKEQNSVVVKIIIRDKEFIKKIEHKLSVLKKTDVKIFNARLYCEFYKSFLKKDYLTIDEYGIIKYNNNYYSGGIELILFIFQNESESFRKTYCPDTNFIKDID